MLRHVLAPIVCSVSKSAVFKLAAINNSLLGWFAFRLLRDKMFSLEVAHTGWPKMAQFFGAP